LVTLEEFSVFNQSGVRLPVTRAKFAAALEIFCEAHRTSVDLLELVVVDEAGIVDVNNRFLNRTYVTDIISFSYNEELDAPVEGTLFVCAQRVKEQAAEFKSSQETEFMRVFFHGLLHLKGMNDDTPELKEAMHKAENELLVKLGYAIERR
jgi:rRNA maturation RNase YbeY